MYYCLFSRFKESVKDNRGSIACQIKENLKYETYTYQDLYAISLKVSAFLIRQEVSKGDRIAILLENSPLWPAVFFGILGAACVSVPIDPKLTPQEINNIIRDSQARILFTQEELYHPVKDLLKNILSFKEAHFYPFDEIRQIKAPTQTNPRSNPDDTASLLYTSGTTALPKGVMLTHRNLLSNFESINKLNIIRAQDNILSILPLHHSYPLMVTLISPLLIGAKITYLKSLKSEDLILCMKETRVSLLVGVPQLFAVLHKAIFDKLKGNNPLLFILKAAGLARKYCKINLNKLLLRKLHNNFGGALRFFISGGARLDPKITSDLMLLGFTILEGYGLTETSPVVTFNPRHNPKAGSVGMPLPGVEIKIDTTKEILIKGPNVMKGYYKRPKETQEVIKDGWFYSGDLGFIDKKGYLYLTGRSKEVIVLSSGKNIYPEEVETHYLNTPYIKEICVFELPHEGLQSLHAVVVPNTDYFRKTKEVNIQGKIRWLMENLSKELPSYKRIMGFVVSKEDLPKTRLGKLKRYEIKEIYQNIRRGKLRPPQKQAISENAAEETLKEKLLRLLSKELKTSVTADDHMELDLGVDSLSRVELGIALEKTLKISIPDSIISEVFTVAELIERIEKLKMEGIN